MRVDTVTITATGTDAYGNDTGDVTDDLTLESDVETDEVVGNTVRFPTASPHTITATHVSGASASILIEVIPPPLVPEPPGPGPSDPGGPLVPGNPAPPADPGGGSLGGGVRRQPVRPGVPSPRAQLPVTGVPSGLLLGTGALLLAAGLTTNLRARRTQP